MAIFQTDRRNSDIGHIHINGFQYVTDDPEKVAFLRRNIGPHLWEIVLNKKGGIKQVIRGEPETTPIQTEVVDGEVLIKTRGPRTVRGGRTTLEVMEKKEKT